METSSLDSYQYFSHTLRRGEMPAGGAFQILHLIPTWESMQMSFAFLFMHCLRLCLNHLTHRRLLEGLYTSPFLSACILLCYFLRMSAVGSAGWDWGVCRWCLRKGRGHMLWIGPSWGESVSGCAAEIPAASLCFFWAVSAPVWLSKWKMSGSLWSETFCFWKKSYFSLVAQFIEWLYRKIALLTVK